MTDDGTTAIHALFPVNPSGGVLSSNPIGASGMIRFVEAALQAQGKAGEHQIEGAVDRPRGRVRCDGARPPRWRCCRRCRRPGESIEGETMTMSMREISDRLEIQDLMLRQQLRNRSAYWDACSTKCSPPTRTSTTGCSAERRRSSNERSWPRRCPTSLVYQHMVSATTIRRFYGDTAETETQCHNPMVMGYTDDPDRMMCDSYARTACAHASTTVGGSRNESRRRSTCATSRGSSHHDGRRDRADPDTPIRPFAHAGASHYTYRSYLEDLYLDDFYVLRATTVSAICRHRALSATGTTSGASSSRPTASSAR